MTQRQRNQLIFKEKFSLFDDFFLQRFAKSCGYGRSYNLQLTRLNTHGGVAEWSIALVLKAVASPPSALIYKGFS
ncbi:hypothetical protein [Hydrogenophaga aquatica]